DQPDRGFYTFEENNFDTSSNYIIITDELQADDLDVRRMAAFATAGNNIFISAYALPQKLQDTLGIQLQNSLDLLPSDSAGYMTNFADPKIRTKEGYRFRHESLSFQIENAGRHKVNHLADDSSESSSIVMRDRIVLGKDAKENANFVKIPFGKGAFFIHTFPLAFTNYNMLKKDHNEYVSKCLSFLPNRRTHWDEYYKPFSTMKADSPLRFILSVPSYSWAYYIALFALAIYMLFASKRTQRIIPILTPPANLSLEFTRTIGSLYYQQRDHRDIAVKKMIYLLEKLRQYYFLQTADTSEAFRTKLAYRSNVNMDTINEVFNIYDRDIRRVRFIDERTLISFNTALEKFYSESGLINK
ncbi:MAG: hypothetical protein JWO03_3235, partial [Bacteroidetes bacterium]|nr:hypothetical protein [Bacteroidota bacterium]